MYDQMGSLLKSFDEVFNDDFLATADEDEIEQRFKFMEELCAVQKIDYRQLMDELEFHCNSFISQIVAVEGRSGLRQRKKNDGKPHQQGGDGAASPDAGAGLFLQECIAGARQQQAQNN